jgi:hypothetical protein
MGIDSANWAGGGWRARLMIRAVLRSADPVKAITGQSPADGYDESSWELARSLVSKGTKPAERDAAWIAYGTMADSYHGITAFDEALFQPIDRLIVKGWDTSFSLTA